MEAPPPGWGLQFAGPGDPWWGEVTFLSAFFVLFSRGCTLNAGQALRVLGQVRTVCSPDLSALNASVSQN